MLAAQARHTYQLRAATATVNAVRSVAKYASAFKNTRTSVMSRFSSTNAASTPSTPSSGSTPKLPFTTAVSSTIFQNVQQNPILPEYLTVRDSLYADAGYHSFISLHKNMATVAEAYTFIQQQKYAQAEEVLTHMDDMDPAVILSLAYVFQQQGRTEDAVQVLLHYVENVNEDSHATLCVWSYLRTLGYKPSNELAQNVLGVVLERGLPTGTDLIAIYADRRSYRISHGGRGGALEFLSHYPLYPSLEMSREKREVDLQKYGDLDMCIANEILFLLTNNGTASAVIKTAPIENAPVGAPVTHPETTTNFFQYMKSKAATADDSVAATSSSSSSSSSSSTPFRLSFLTPGGKHILEGEWKSVMEATGSLQTVAKSIHKIDQFTRLVRRQKPDSARDPQTLCLSHVAQRAAGFDRRTFPAAPLLIPEHIRKNAQQSAQAKRMVHGQVKGPGQLNRPAPV